ncbi:hypothetical protein [Bdellovibrio svalbardensis]|uniref:Bdellovibrio beta-sandwich domain-containing protein n=1 Tax=Bdellovibrio svalbardensis TaxID=2972972 RepID=A0ABT6DMG5_9BACT|nr:hypothetical protein [Bdellovibrio svalbardensis]MDG0817809.1 hypothetical protein [Bdellovibrio svalbardensis]
MLKWIVLLITALSLNTSFAWNDLPQPLPEDPGQQQPVPPPQPPSGVPVRYSLGTAELSRFKESEFTFYPQVGLNKLARLSLTAGRNNIEIKEVRIQYADYMDERLDYVLPGDLKSGNTRTISMDARPIYRIKVKAIASYFWKKPGNFRVDVAAYR